MARWALVLFVVISSQSLFAKDTLISLFEVENDFYPDRLKALVMNENGRVFRKAILKDQWVGDKNWLGYLNLEIGESILQAYQLNSDIHSSVFRVITLNTENELRYYRVKFHPEEQMLGQLLLSEDEKIIGVFDQHHNTLPTKVHIITVSNGQVRHHEFGPNGPQIKDLGVLNLEAGEVPLSAFDHPVNGWDRKIKVITRNILTGEMKLYTDLEATKVNHGRKLGNVSFGTEESFRLAYQRSENGAIFLVTENASGQFLRRRLDGKAGPAVPVGKNMLASPQVCESLLMAAAD